MLADLSALAGAIGTATTGLTFVAHPTQANAIKLRRGSLMTTDVWSTLGVAPGTVIALDPLAFASAFGSEPEFSVSKETLLHMSDVPAALLANPSASLFQSDLIATQLRLRCAWAWRVAGAVAWVASTTW